MRVLIDCRMASWSGVGRYTRGLVRALSQRGELELIQLLVPGQEPLVDAEVARAGGSPLGPRGMLAFGGAVTAVRPDVTHCTHFPTPFPADHPLVVTVHDIIPIRVPSSMPNPVSREAFARLVRRAITLADRVICPSVFTAQDIAAFAPRAESKTRVTPLAADDLTAGPVGSLPPWLAGKRFILGMGNPKPHKGLATLMRAFAALAKRYPDLMLVLAGEQPAGFLDGVLGADPARGRIRFTGPLRDAALRALYADAELFAFPTAYEGFGLPPLEAMAHGTPVVTTAAASVPEVVGCAAVTVEPGDVDGLATAMSHLLDDASARNRLRQAGLVRAAQFSWALTAERTAAVYEEVLAR